MHSVSNPFESCLSHLEFEGKKYKYFDLNKINFPHLDRLPYSIRILLEAAIRCCDEYQVTSSYVKSIVDWEQTQNASVEIPFRPSRVILQDFTGVPALVDFASMRDAVQRLGGDPNTINPICPVDLVIDHSIQVDMAKSILRVSIDHGAGRGCSIKEHGVHHNGVKGDLFTLPHDGRMVDSVGRKSPYSSPNSRKFTSRSSPHSSGSSKQPPSGLWMDPSSYASRHSHYNSKSLQPLDHPSLPTHSSPFPHLKCDSHCVYDKLLPESLRISTTMCPFHHLRVLGAEALEKNQKLEFERNKERFAFIKWGASAFKNMQIIPPGSGIVHQVNLEYLARVVFVSDEGLLYPDSLVGTDSHTTMINGLGVLGWGVGGIEAEAVMLGQSISMVLPKVVGYRIHGTLNPMVTSTDIVLTITRHLRQIGVVGKFVEFFGSGVSRLSIADRATISNMCPEYGATVGFFPVDTLSIEFLRQTGRDPDKLRLIEAYLRSNKLFRQYEDAAQDPTFTEVAELDLSTVVPCCSGPKRPHDKVNVSNMASDFSSCLTSPQGFKGIGISPDHVSRSVSFNYNGSDYSISHGAVVIAALTSCTNTSNPSVMLGAGLVARKAVEAGLSVKPYIKTSLSPGSGVVTLYLEQSGSIPYLEKLGFSVVGYGCMTCIGNSGPLPEPVGAAIEEGDLVACGVLSGNRNFEGRIHPLTRANYLASPMLVVAYAIAGTVLIDFETEPIGHGSDGKPVFLRDIWPSRTEIQEVEKEFVVPSLFSTVYKNIEFGNEDWQALDVTKSSLYPWDESSTYIKNPPFFDEMTCDLPEVRSIDNAKVLLFLGDSVTTDHISPAGSIARNSPAAKYLTDRGLFPRAFNSYGSRRGNDSVMERGTFANIRLVNKLVSSPGPKTFNFLSGEVCDIFDAAMAYKKEEIPIIVLAGKEYGSGSSRDWAAKGPWLLGIRAVIAESYERIHRSNLVGMGLFPLQFLQGQTASTLELTGKETYEIHIPDDLGPRHTLPILVNGVKRFDVLCRVDTDVELAYIRHGGILNYTIRRMLAH